MDINQALRQPEIQVFKRALEICKQVPTRTVYESQLISELETIVSLYPNLLLDSRGTQLVHAASMYRSKEFCDKLIALQGGLDAIRSQDHDGNLPIHHAIVHGNLELVQYLLGLYPGCVSVSNEVGHYPIHCCRASDTEITTFLLDNDDIAPMRVCNLGMTPLAKAIENSNDEVAMTLYNAWPHAIFTEDENGVTPLDILHFHVNANQGNLFLRRFFSIQQSVIDDIEQCMIHNPNYASISHALVSPASLGTIKLLHEKYPDACYSIDSQKHQSCLHVAVSQRNRSEEFIWLVKNSESLVSIRDDEDNTVLHIACRFGCYKAIIFLVKNYPWMIGSINSDKRSPLQVLIEESSCNKHSKCYLNVLYTLIQEDPNSGMQQLMSL